MRWFKKKHSPVVSPMVTLTTERLVLRGFEKSDAMDVFAYAQNPNVGPLAGWKPHASIEESRGVVAHFMRYGEVWAVVSKQTGRVIGSVGLHADERRNVEGARMLGYALGEEAWGHGYATEACRAVLRYAFEELSLRVVSVYHFPDNQRSKHVIKKLGFQCEGVLRVASTLPDGSLTDEVCYSMTDGEYIAQREEAAKCRR